MNKTGCSVQRAGSGLKGSRAQRLKGSSTRNGGGFWIVSLFMLFIFALQGCGGGGDTPTNTCPPIDYEGKLSSAWSSYDSGNYNAALSAFSAVPTLTNECSTPSDSQSARAYSGMGYSNYKLNDITNAKSSFTSATQKSSTLTEAYAGLALVTDAQDSYTEMKENAVKVESLDPSFSFAHSPALKIVDMYVIAARGYLAAGDLTNSRTYYCKAKSADPAHVSVKQLEDFYNTYKNPSLAACP